MYVWGKLKKDCSFAYAVIDIKAGLGGGEGVYSTLHYILTFCL